MYMNQQYQLHHIHILKMRGRKWGDWDASRWTKAHNPKKNMVC